MGEFDSGRSKYVTSHETPPQGDTDGLWMNYGTSISLGFVATGVLISMFVIMAIFEHLFKPNASFRLTQHTGHRPNDMQKLVDPQPPVQSGYRSDLSVLMPGKQYPTYIAHPTPLPCLREGVYWPSHRQHNLVHP
ncbi:uncharacterized protein LOC112506199 [Cynara cardunculus var. scolymus]|uniref:Uncharacterized protein n=1 Tax=Cynara cardunculus var. scolymus TaxID=59895 RepID=A0A103YL76_CYNCS|nr:uncharacterized protein LOC112506199 [Cynara cardunculus var. scolymus]KVI11062.1 hypothetical protein Ccrd_010530 [Cynara cardunculus var. scolymus]